MNEKRQRVEHYQLLLEILQAFGDKDIEKGIARSSIFLALSVDVRNPRQQKLLEALIEAGLLDQGEIPNTKGNPVTRYFITPKGEELKNFGDPEKVKRHMEIATSSL